MALPSTVVSGLAAVVLCGTVLLDAGTVFPTVLISDELVESLLGDAVVTSVVFVGTEAVDGTSNTIRPSTLYLLLIIAWAWDIEIKAEAACNKTNDFVALKKQLMPTLMSVSYTHLTLPTKRIV